MYGRDISWAILNILRPLLLSLGLFGLLYFLRKRIRWRYMALAIGLLAGLALYYYFGKARLANFSENSLNLIVLAPLPFSLGLMGFLYCLKKRIYWQYMAFAVMCLLMLSLYFLTGRVVSIGVHLSLIHI